MFYQTGSKIKESHLSKIFTYERIRANHHEMREQFMANNTKRLLSDDRGTVKGVRRDGSEFFAEVSLSTIPNLLGNNLCVCVSVRDVTERFNSFQRSKPRPE